MSLTQWSDRPRIADAHRHGLYDVQPEFSLAGVPVERWEEDQRFLKHELWTKSLSESGLREAMRPWLQCSKQEGVGTILDFSGKHARHEIASVYDQHGITHFTPEWWSRWQPMVKPLARALILPDERALDEHVAEKAREFLATVADGFVTLHALESLSSARRALGQWGLSTVVWLDHQRLLTPRTVLVHMNATTLDDLHRVREKGAHLVYCPAVRLAMRNPAPPFLPRVRLHFGTDAPLVSGERRLWAQAALQYRLWCQAGVPERDAIKEATLALFRPLPGTATDSWRGDPLVKQFGVMVSSLTVDPMNYIEGGLNSASH
jgi:hypothetical protein